MRHRRFLNICKLVHKEALRVGYQRPRDERGRFVAEKRPVLVYRNFGSIGNPRIEVHEHYRSRSLERYRTVILFQDTNDPDWFILIEVENLTHKQIRARFRIAVELFIDHQRKRQ